MLKEVDQDRREGLLVLLGTPIGNLSDLSERAIEALRRADVIAAEDTRRTRTLLSHLKIEKKVLIAIDANREQSLSEKVVDLVRSGNIVVYTTDAGMPGISDPGALLISAVSSASLPIDAIPGPSAPILAASLSGLCNTGFLFSGFLPNKSGARKKLLVDFAKSGLALIVFESPNRIAALLGDALETYGSDHAVFVGRELTKLYQELFYGTLGDARDHFAAKAQRGEFVVVFGSVSRSNADADLAQVLRKIVEVLGEPKSKTKVVSDEIAALTGLRRNDVYEILVSARSENDSCKRTGVDV